MTALAASLAGAGELDDQELDRLIDKHRRADFEVTVKTADGQPEAAPVRYALERHAFEFGTAISASMTGAPSKSKRSKRATAEELAAYEAIVTNYFTAAVMENAMKWSQMERSDGTLKGVERALYCERWCRERDLKLRGHCIFWGIPRWLPTWQKEDLVQEPPVVIEKRMKRRLNLVLELFRGRLHEWDLYNEMMHGDIFGEAIGLEDLATYFEWAKAADSNITYYVNEYGVLQGKEVDQYVAHIKGLLDSGAQVGGIGDQAHFFKPIPSNEALWEILDKLGQFGLPVKVTEFDLKYKDMTLEDQAEQVRRFYRVCFAHPAVAGIYMWGFTDRRQWRKAGLWDSAMQPKPAAHAYMKLLKEEWNTYGEAVPENGVLRFRGYPGTYRFSTDNGMITVELTTDTPAIDAVLAGPEPMD